MKKINRAAAYILLIGICLMLFSCAKEPQPVKLSEGNFEIIPESVIKYDEAFLRYDDPFDVALAVTRPKEAYMKPDFAGTITELRVSLAKRDLPLNEWYQDNLSHDNEEVYQFYYGFFSDGVWHDFPAENYDLKIISEPGSGPLSLQFHHVVRIGPYILIAFKPYSSTHPVTIEDTLNSSALRISKYEHAYNGYEYSYIIDGQLKISSENDVVFITGPIDTYYIAVEYDTLPKDYSVTFKQEHPKRPIDVTFTYDDIMEALNREW